MRTFESGATRNSDSGKYDYEGFFSPLVVERFAAYMHKHRQLETGELRDSDNWQKGIPQAAYIKSAWRHFLDWWREHRGLPSTEGIEDALCALLFNVQGYLHEHLKRKSAPPTSTLDVGGGNGPQPLQRSTRDMNEGPEGPPPRLRNVCNALSCSRFGQPLNVQGYCDGRG